MNLRDQSGIVNNDTDHNKIDVKPPALTYGADEHGAYVDMVGTEAVQPLTIIPTTPTNLNSTKPGDLILVLPVDPTFLANTRFKSLTVNYGRWKPMAFAFEYVPLGSSIQAGGLIMCPLIDPSDTLVSTTDNIQRIQRAMDYACSKSFNVYNTETMHCPELPPDEEPFYIRGNGSARFTVPYVLNILAQSAFPADPTAPNAFERTLGWINMHYHIRLYDAVLPQLEDVVTEHNVVMSGFTPGVIWDTENPDNCIGSGVRLFASAFQPLPKPKSDPDTILIATVVVTPTRGTMLDTVFIEGKEVTVQQGDVFYLKSEGSVDIPSNQKFAMYASLDDAKLGTNVLTWSSNLGLFVYTSGLLNMKGYTSA